MKFNQNIGQAYFGTKEYIKTRLLFLCRKNAKEKVKNLS